MVGGVENQTVIRIDNALGIPITAIVVDITFVIIPPIGFGEKSLNIAEIVPADDTSGRNLPKISLIALPSQIPRLAFGDIIGGKMAV